MKVISFSLWGKNPKYLVGAIRNAELARELYPDWTCRFYIGDDVPTDIVAALWDVYPGRWTNVPYDMEHRKKYCSIVWSQERDSIQTVRMLGQPCNWKAMFWRFNALNKLGLSHGEKEEIEAIIVRDCDSRLSMREKEAVDAWLESDKGFHTMHAHFHHSVPILGGMFGIKRNCLSDFHKLMSSWKQEDRWQTDQEFLSQIIWPLVKDNTMNHADFHTDIWPGIPFPSPMIPNEFIGATYDENDCIDQSQLKALYGN